MTEVLGNINLSARANRDWWRDAVVYQIYARSFADSNNDGVGDIEGIRSRLSYLSELGVDAIWITPCYDTPWNDGGYDVANYYEIAKNVGTTEQVTKLAEELHQNNMKLILDLVPNHTSSEHEWFQAARRRQVQQSKGQDCSRCRGCCLFNGCNIARYIHGLRQQASCYPDAQ